MTLLTGWPSITDDSGNGTSGTAINKTNIWDVIKAAIEALVHSSTNPNVTPANIIDEVVAARGNELSLDARISGVIDDDGNLVSQASLVTAAQYQAGHGARNIALNGNLMRWTNGAALAPDDFALTGAAATIARTGSGESDTFTFGAGKYAVKITRAGTDADLTQTVIASADWTSFEKMEAQKVSVGAWIKTSVASHARLVISDGATETNSSYHTGGGSAEFITVVHTISTSATKLEFRCEVNSSNGDAYFGGFVFLVSQLAPTVWQFGVIDYASADQGGLLSSGAQDIPGVKNFKEHPFFEVGSQATTQGKVNGTIARKTGTTNSSTGGAVDMFSHTLKGGTLNEDGDEVEMTLFFDTLNDADNKQINLVFGSTTVVLFNAALNNEQGYIRFHIFRTGAATQVLVGEVIASAGTAQTVVTGAPTETLANDITMKITSSTTTHNADITCGPGHVRVR